MHLTIGDLERLTGIPKATLRYYDSIGLLCPERREGSNYRRYTQEDLVRLVQVRQLNALGLQLSELPAEGKDTGCGDLNDSLVARQRALEEEIDRAIDQLGRLRLHINSFGQALEAEHTIKLAHTSGNYRLFPTDPGVAEHPETAEIVRKWISLAPHCYSCVRVRKESLLAEMPETCPATLGIGLMKHVFDAGGETFRAPMQYSPLARCIQGVIETPSPERIPAEALRPFVDFLRGHTLIPLDDMYGWIVYTPAEGTNEPFRISMRWAVS
ncbi:MAG: MerR family transcriptional regulator [Clostridia bacterium]|nr:MerR family transcriptional regulator [Clostridia bacterium]